MGHKVEVRSTIPRPRGEIIAVLTNFSDIPRLMPDHVSTRCAGKDGSFAAGVCEGPAALGFATVRGAGTPLSKGARDTGKQ